MKGRGMINLFLLNRFTALNLLVSQGSLDSPVPLFFVAGTFTIYSCHSRIIPMPQEDNDPFQWIHQIRYDLFTCHVTADEFTGCHFRIARQSGEDWKRVGAPTPRHNYSRSRKPLTEQISATISAASPQQLQQLHPYSFTPSAHLTSQTSPPTSTAPVTKAASPTPSPTETRFREQRWMISYLISWVFETFQFERIHCLFALQNYIGLCVVMNAALFISTLFHLNSPIKLNELSNHTGAPGMGLTVEARGNGQRKSKSVENQQK